MVQGTVDAVHLFPRLLLSVLVPMGLQNMALEMMEAATQGLRASLLSSSHTKVRIPPAQQPAQEQMPENPGGTRALIIRELGLSVASLSHQVKEPGDTFPGSPLASLGG